MRGILSFTIKRTLIASIAGLALLFAATPSTAAAAAATCTDTGFSRDGIPMTAAQIGGDVTGSLDAGGCNVGVYYDSTHTGNVAGATIFGANYFGVLVNGDVGSVTVNVTNSTIRDIGETPLNGSQHGNAIYYRAMDATDDLVPSAIGTASGVISGNTVGHYQKNGITVRGSVSATVSNNVVTGEGPVDYIAQNGIQVSYGATALVKGNTVSGNYYTPAGTIACGLLLYQAAGVKTSGNTLVDNERDLCNFGRGGGHFNAS
jgi:hypothetical protein